MVGTMERHRTRWLRALSRVLLLLVGAVQCLLGVIFGVGLAASALVYAGDGPGLVISSVLFLALDVVLFVGGLLALLSSLEAWDPPYDRWRGVRWPLLGCIGGGASVLSWLVAAAFIWAM
ncbi:MAG TPA: hypothetical protein VIO16_02460 [Dehalococcoidia bacterium]